MKILHIRPYLFSALLLFPFLLNAGWHAVRNDGYNAFQKVFTVNDNTAFVIGRGNFPTADFILRTNDGGSTWDSIPMNIPDNVYLNQLFFTNGNNGFIGGGGYRDSTQFLLKTTDNGNTWTAITPDPTSSHAIISVHFINAQNGYVTDGISIYKTQNGGTSWTVQTPSFTPGNLSFIDMNNGFACGGMDEGTTAVIMKTIDGGQNWSNLLSIPRANYYFDKLEIINQQNFYVSVSSDNIIYKTTDGGSSWDVLALLQTWGILDIHLATGHVLSTNSEVFRTDDEGQSWTLEYAAEWGFYGPSIYYTSISFAENTGFMVGSSGMIKKYSIATGIRETEEEVILMYPNPLTITDELHINTSGITEQFNLQIMNASGQVVLQRNQAANTPVLTISDLTLAPGIYFAAIQTNKTRNVGKLIIVE